MMIIYAKLFSNPTMHNKVMGLTHTGFTEVYAQGLSADCDLELLIVNNYSEFHVNIFSNNRDIRKCQFLPHDYAAADDPRAMTTPRCFLPKQLS